MVVSVGYHTHGHHRSLSSLASSIMPITSDTSTTTSIIPSPIDPKESTSQALELKTSTRSDTNAKETERVENAQSDRKKPPTKTEEEKEGLENSESPDQQPISDLENSITSKVTSHVSDGVSWTTLVERAQEETFETRRWAQLRKDVAKTKLLNGIGRRLQATSTIAYGDLIDQFKGDDQAGFTGLYEASERLSTRCKTSFEEQNSSASAALSADEPRYQGFQVAEDDAESILSFLNRLRTDLDYLSNLIAELPSDDLSSLTSCYHPAGVELSILPNHSHGRTLAYSRDSQMMKLSRRMDNIATFHNKDPYFALLHTVFDPCAIAGSREDQLRKQVWARSCAKVVTDRKEGSEEFIIATIDSFISTDTWSLKADIELYILDVLAEGWFVLDPPMDEPNDSNGSNWEPERASHAISVAEFFDRQAEKFLNMLDAQGRTPLPAEGLEFIRLVLLRLEDPQTRELAKKFIVSRWYFASFIASLLVYPEVRGLCLGHHIGDSARKKILHRLALHIQSQVFSVLAPSALTYILPEVREQVLNVTEQFEPPADNGSGDLSENPQPAYHLMMSPWDLVGLVETLKPDRYEENQGNPLHQFGSRASSTTLRPDTNTIHTDLNALQYAESSSTDTTMVDDSTTKDTQDRKYGGKTQGTSTPRPLTRLDKAISVLRSSALALTRDRAGYTSRDWIHFQVDPEDSRLRLEQGSTRDIHLVEESIWSDLDQIDRSSASYRISREAVLSLLFPESGHHANQSQLAELGHSGSFSPLLESRIADAKSKHQFKLAQTWARRLTAYRSFEETIGPAAYTSLSRDVDNTISMRIQRLQRSIKSLEIQSTQLEMRRQSNDKVLQEILERRMALRVKMWYASDVKNSGPYEEALRVTRALRAMANPKKPKPATGFASWARQRLRGSTSYVRADKQALELMCASKEEGGLGKLGDDQIEIATRFNTRNNIATFCQSEERIHRFFSEVQKLVQKLSTTNMQESPVLWASHLFRQEKRAFDSLSMPSPPTFTPSPITPPLGSQAFSNAWSPQRNRNPTGLDRLRGSTDFNGLQITSAPHTGYATLSNRFDGHRSSTPSAPHGYLSPPMTPVSPRPVEVFSPQNPHKSARVPKAKQEFVESLRNRLLGLVNSDLGYLLWAAGSETDVWIRKVSAQLENVDPNQAMDGHNHHQTSPHLDPMQVTPQITPTDQFDLQESYAIILSTMSLSQDPRRKLEMLSSLQELILSSHETEEMPDRSASSSDTAPSSTVSSLTKVTDQCRQRYSSSIRRPRSNPKSSIQTGYNSSHITYPPTEIIETLQTIFSNPSLRPPALFRDLQCIASLVPQHTLDHTGEGSAFWTASIAALSLKDNLIAQVISRAQAITDYHLSIRATHPPLLPPTDKDTLSSTILKDAADLWMIGAKEGNSTAARELALFYLTHPELLKRTTMPMTTAKEVFGTNVTGAGGAALDPKTFCVVLHWMQIAASGGDQQAFDFLRENSGKNA